METADIIQRYIDAENKVLNPFNCSLEPAKGDRGWGGLSFGVKNIDSERHAVEAVLSSDTVDRYGEIVDPAGFEPFLERFNQNPQLLKGHDHDINLGHWEKMKITKHTFEGWAVFDDSDPEAMKIYRKYEKKIMRAFSVGFIAHEWEMVEEGKGRNKRMRRRFTLQEPLEGSAVTIPANHTALSKALTQFNRGGEADGDTPITDAMREMFKSLLGNALKSHEEQITEKLTDPDGPMAMMIADAIQNAIDREGLGGYFDAPADAGAKSSGSGDTTSGGEPLSALFG